jgi:hypothetical protein
MKTDDKEKCGGLNQQDEPCPWRKVGKYYCKRHLHYEDIVTPKEFTKLPKCSNCKNRYIKKVGEEEYSTCSKCRESRIEKNKAKSNIPICKKCDIRAIKGEEHCTKHYNEIKDAKTGIKRCSSKWSCNKVLDKNYTKKWCEKCRTKDSEDTRRRKEEKLGIYIKEEILQNVNNMTTDDINDPLDIITKEVKEENMTEILVKPKEFKNNKNIKEEILQNVNNMTADEINDALDIITKEVNEENMTEILVKPEEFKNNENIKEELVESKNNMLPICSTCNNRFTVTNSKYITCDKCRENNIDKTKIFCKIITRNKTRCTYQIMKCSDFCEYHYKKEIKKISVPNGFKKCSKATCKNLLLINDVSKWCDKCKTHEKTIKQEKQKTIIINEDERVCTKCPHKFNVSEFMDKNNDEVKRCKSCRNKQKVQDDKRSDRKRDLKAEYAKNPNRKIHKTTYNKLHKAMITEAYKKSRKKRREMMGSEAYLKHEANNMKQWKINNPERHSKYVKKYKDSLVSKLYMYQYEANEKNIEFKLTEDEQIKMFEQKCYYCNYSEKDKLNGIDRLNNDIGYILDNCVSCCSLCNYMKATLPVYIFVKRCEHIAVYNKLTDHGKLYSKLFTDHGAIKQICKYKKRANKKNISFELTNDQFKKLIVRDCYICGKEATENNCNGIDRFDNDIGYTLENSKSCCTECNFSKKNFDYNVFLNQCLKIYCNCLTKNIVKIKNLGYMHITTTNRPKKEPINKEEKKLITKCEQEKHFVYKYSDENIKKEANKKQSDFEKALKLHNIDISQINTSNMDMDNSEIKKVVQLMKKNII